ncbi:ArsC family reductase [Bosea sp. (in: a-proteobacteria)]|uniref:ArsC family reductase n=1 Tax=Bosea vestrisii TaxID=151416 RepID=A0ABW0H544_9HYPH|nr:ArsC family reductase [Bosea sp. (in: a-proteobacteria)]MBA4223774.1 ArsC family reductase [Methylobacterium sp.]MBR3194272.1 ArsC family reductase [Bosea sp. (in: a-proteobacteria)]
MVTLYGIKNCDTMKKAWSWLDAHNIAYAFHDYRVSGIDKARLEAWCRELGWEKVLNKASTTFRELPEADRQSLDETKAIALMLAQPTMIKRPVLDLGDRRILAFKPDVYQAAFAKR